MKIKKLTAFLLIFIMCLPAGISLADPLADLTIGEVYLSNPNFKAGDYIDVYVYIKNVGIHSTDSKRYDIYLRQLEGCEAVASTTYAYWTQMDDLGPGQESLYRFTNIKVLSDTISFTASVDESNWQKENNRANNKKRFTFKSLINDTDLEIRSISVDKDVFNQGEELTLSANIKNNGGADFPYTEVEFEIDINGKKKYIKKAIGFNSSEYEDVELTKITAPAENFDISVNVLCDEYNIENNLHSQKIASNLEQADYTWRSMTMYGGGLVSGSYADYENQDIYFYTDVGGFYKYNRGVNKFFHLNVGLDTSFPWCTEGMVAKGDLIFAAVNEGSNAGHIPYIKNSALIRSTDGGTTWTKLDAPVLFAGGADRKGTKHIMELDPNNSNVLVCGSYREGVYITDNALSDNPTWRKVDLPGLVLGEIAEAKDFAKHTKAVAIDSRKTIDGKSSDIYVASFAKGVYHSKNAGKTFELIPGSPAGIYSIRFSKNGKLYAATQNAVWSYSDSSWKDISPKKGATYRNIDVSEINPDNVAAATVQGVYYSNDGGTIWKNGLENSNLTRVSIQKSFAYELYNINWDPVHENGLWFSTWFGAYKTDDVTAKVQEWEELAGIEELCILRVVAPYGSDKVYSLSMDSKLNMKEKEHLYDYTLYNSGSPDQHEGLALDNCRSNPDFIAHTGCGAWYLEGGGSAGYTYDGGKTYTSFPNIPLAADGKTKMVFSQIAVSPEYNENGVPTIVVAPVNTPLLRTDDLGVTWTEVKGAPNGVGEFGPDIDLVSDLSGRFYTFNNDTGDLYVSEDDGVTFTKSCNIVPTQTRILRAFPENEGYMALATGTTGLYLSTDAGKSFARLENIQNAEHVAIGKRADDSAYDTIYLKGTVHHKDGFFRSTDLGKTWVQLYNNEYSGSNTHNTMDADKTTFGIVYVGTSGHGILTGMPREIDLAPSEIAIVNENNIIVKNNIFSIRGSSNKNYDIDVSLNGVKVDTAVVNRAGDFYSTVILEPGVNHIKVSYNALGSSPYAEANLEVTYDPNYFVIENLPEHITTGVKDYTITGSTNGTAVVTVNSEGAYFDSNSNVFTKDVELTSGDNLFKVTATDANGNVIQKDIIVTYDDIEPVLVFEQNNTVTDLPMITLTGELSETAQITFNGAAQSFLAGRVEYDVPLEVGDNKLEFEVKDGVGNISAVKTTVTFSPKPEYVDSSSLANAVRGTAVIDGNLDEWQLDRFVHDIIDGYSDNTALFAWKYDDEFLYFGIKVRDKKLVFYDDEASASSYKQDSVEIFFDPEGNRATSYDALDKQILVNSLSKVWDCTKARYADEITAAFKSVEDGYNVELMIPMSYVNVDLAKGSFNFGVSINESESADLRDGVISWCAPTSAYMNTSEYGVCNFK